MNFQAHGIQMAKKKVFKKIITTGNLTERERSYILICKIPDHKCAEDPVKGDL